jgi:NADPH:quinone reductase-like Zn-dependent oxidoreductase
LRKRFGARVIATTSSDEKAERLKAVGADDVINYRKNSDWHVLVREMTAGRGVDQVLETVGGTLEQSIKSTALDGQINFIGRLSGGVSTIDANVLYNAVATIRVIFAGNRDQFIAMNRAITVNRLKPIIDRVFPFTELPAAFQYFETGGNFGKVVIMHS